MKTQFYTWDDLPEKYKELILAEAGKDWDFSKRHGGPLVRIDPLCEDYQECIPDAVSIRLDQCHDRWEIMYTDDSIVTVWFNREGNDMNFYRIEISWPLVCELTPTILFVRAPKAPTLAMVRERLSLDETVEIRVHPATVVTWEF